MDIRQVALVARDLPSSQAAFFQLLGLSAGYHDPNVAEFGLHNVVMRLGDTYLEIVSPIQEGTTAGRLLDRRGGDSGYMVLVQVEDFAEHRSRMAETDIRIVWESPFDHAKGMHLHPSDVPGAIVSLDAMTPPEAWHWAGDQWETQERASRAGDIVAAEIACTDPQAVAQRWSIALDRPTRAAGAYISLPLDHTEIRFTHVPEKAQATLSAVDIRTPDAGAVLETAQSMGLAVSDKRVSLGGVSLNFVS